MTTLLPEVVHSAIFKKTKPVPDHDGPGTDDEDPQRHWLSLKRNKRWLKLLYCTPALMPIYFRAAAQEVKTYPAALRALIPRERLATIVIQLSAGYALYHFNRTYREEVLNAYLSRSTAEAQALSDTWLADYNEHRPHDALGRVPPLTYLPRVSPVPESRNPWLT
jgi:hypothetical protein